VNPRLVDPAELLGVDTDGETWRIDGATLHTLGVRVGGHRHDAERLLITHALAAGADLDPFEIRVGEWYLDLPAATARAVINGTVLTSALAALHQASIPAAVLSVIVPFVFDVEHVRLSSSDRYVYALLRRKQFDRKAIDDWYVELPPGVRGEIARLEFRDLVERLEQAGLVDLDLFDQLGLHDVSDRRLVRLELPPLDG